MKTVVWVRISRRILMAALCAGALFFGIGAVHAGAAAGRGVALSGDRLENRTGASCRAHLLIEGPQGIRRSTLQLSPGQVVECLEPGERLVLLDWE